MGELDARTLLLVARDFAASLEGPWRDLLAPVRLLDFLNVLFGSELWAGSHRQKFAHWIVTTPCPRFQICEYSVRTACVPADLDPQTIARELVGS